MEMPAGKLKVLVIGSGGREHAICWKLAQSKHVESIFCAPGNGGTARENKTRNVEIAVMDFPHLAEFATREGIDLVVVGPDDPLAAGIVDYLQARGLRVFGPRKQAAQLESSKIFAKQFMTAHGIPTARYVVAESLRQGIEAAQENSWARVVKVDGLALGKGVFVCDSEEEVANALRAIFRERRFGDAGRRVLLEERLHGEELSLLMFCDGKRLVPMPASRDHKRRFDGDRGPNTGGMGVFSPVDLYRHCQLQIQQQVLRPIARALQSRSIDYKGVLYAGLMVVAERQPGGGGKRSFTPYVLEFNARFGDPETQALLPLLESDLAEIFFACCEGKLQQIDVRWSKAASCCVIAAAENYPQSVSKGAPIKVGALPEGCHVFHAGTKLSDGKLVTNGGRVLALNAVGGNLEQAVETAYQALTNLSFEGMSYRKDIGRRAPSACLSR
jgi:phosphoribosylamine--glycine ligase